MNKKKLLEEILADENTRNLLGSSIKYTLCNDREAGFEIYLVVNYDSEADKLIFSKKINGKRRRVKNGKARSCLGHHIDRNSQLVYPVISFHTHPFSGRTNKILYPSKADLRGDVRDYKHFKKVFGFLPKLCLDGYADALSEYLRGYLDLKGKRKWSDPNSLIQDIQELYPRRIFPGITPVRIIAGNSIKESPLLIYQFTAIPKIDWNKIPKTISSKLYRKWVEEGIIKEIRTTYIQDEQRISDLDILDSLAA